MCTWSSADVPPERVMIDFKSYATRALKEAGITPADEQLWTRHGSTRYLNDQASVEAACRYVLEDQGRPHLRQPHRAAARR